MLKIGEFAILTGVSIHMLRNYDKIGLLVPEKVDNMNNYRFYGEKQIVRANHIQVLKKLGFGLKEISDILINDMQDQKIKIFLESKIREKEENLLTIQKQITQIQQAVKELDEESGCTLSINIKKLPERNVVSLRGVIEDFTQEGILWHQLDEKCRENGVKLLDVQYCMAMTHYVDFDNKLIDTEVFRVVEKIGQDIQGLRFFKMLETEAAVLAFQGQYSLIGNFNKCLYQWIVENGYRIAGKPFNVYYISPENEKNQENFVTEMCWPLKK